MNIPDVLAMDNIKDVQALNYLDFKDREPITAAEVQHIFELCESFWIHSSDPKDPHAELTHGKCSDGYIDCPRAFSYVNVCQIIAHSAVRSLTRNFKGKINWVVGSAYSAIDFSKDIANFLDTRHGIPEKGENKKQLWQRLEIEENGVVLQAEELMVTSTTTKEVRKGIILGNPNRVRFAPVVVGIHRSDVLAIDKIPLIYVAHFDVQSWAPDECPLCAQGSKRLRPKENWAELTGK